MSNYVETFNQFHAVLTEVTNPATGSLRNDSATRTLLRSLGTLSLTKLTASSGGAPTTLAELGVATNRDGTLSVRSDTLANTLAKYPAAVETIFADGFGASGRGLSAALTAISTAAIDTKVGLAASAARYTKTQSSLADQQIKLGTDEDKLKTQLTQQFAGVDARISAYKSTQAFLTAQVAAWNSQR